MPTPQMAAILGDLAAHKGGFDLSRDRLGATLLEHTARAILAQMDQELDPDGNPWDELSPDYAAYKARLKGVRPISVLEGLMKRLDQIRGEPEIRPDRASMIYGTDDEAKAEAEWFQDPANPNQPARPFYALNAIAVQLADDELGRYFRRLVP